MNSWYIVYKLVCLKHLQRKISFLGIKQHFSGSAVANASKLFNVFSCNATDIAQLF